MDLYLKSFLALFFYAVCSVVIVFVNRLLFSSTFEHPLLVSWVTQLFGTIVILILILLSHFHPILQYFKISFSFRTAIRLIPLSTYFTLMLISTNYCLMYQSISSYQIARSLTLLFNLILSYFWLKDSSSVTTHTCFAVLIVSFGFTIASMDRAILTVPGMISGVIGSLFQALYVVQIKSSLFEVNQNHIILFFYNTLWASVFLFPAVYFTDGFPKLFSGPSFSTRDGKIILLSLLISGLCSLAVNFLSYLAIKITSPLSYSVTGYTKAIVQTCGGIILFKEPVTILSFIGIVLTLTGSVYYSLAATNKWGRNKEIKK